MLLELENVCVSYGNTNVLERLDFRLEEGRIGCLLGPSGCGKTTVLRAIAGFEPVTAGEIRLAGSVVSSPGSGVPPEQRGVRMVFQDFALFPHLTVLENVMFGLADQPRRARKAQALSMLEAVRLAAVAKRYPHEISGGQQQRVALARALVTQPRLVLFDEPFSSLDVELRESLALEVREILKSSGATALFVTHDQQEAFAVADDVGVMDKGRLVQWDSPYNVYHLPRTRFVADFVGQGVFLQGTVEADGRVRTSLGMPRSRAETPMAEGTEVDVLFRPDDIIHDDEAPTKARVISKVFRGAGILYTLELTDSSRVLSLVPSHHNHAIGEKIGIRMDAEHVIVFSRG